MQHAPILLRSCQDATVSQESMARRTCRNVQTTILLNGSCCCCCALWRRMSSMACRPSAASSGVLIRCNTAASCTWPAQAASSQCCLQCFDNCSRCQLTLWTYHLQPLLQCRQGCRGPTGCSLWDRATSRQGRRMTRDCSCVAGCCSPFEHRGGSSRIGSLGFISTTPA